MLRNGGGGLGDALIELGMPGLHLMQFFIVKVEIELVLYDGRIDELVDLGEEGRTVVDFCP
ncbi:hypothetical protein D3C81_2069090 [compost metagenome]